jgi:alcohol dehydrogenase class IV
MAKAKSRSASNRKDQGPADHETIFTVEPVALKYGHGALGELGAEAKALGLNRVLLVTDRALSDLPPVPTAKASLQAAGCEVIVHKITHLEPTDQSFQEAAAVAREAAVDGYISVGGGSVMDTAKAANLYATYPTDDFLDYVNAPVGAAKPVPGPLKPHLACPTTAGTGSETTAVAIFDLVGAKIKTGISSKFLRPTKAIVDPTATYSAPAGVVACTGFDVLTHAIESYTARPFSSRAKPTDPALRPPYQGANPWSDGGALRAIVLGGQYLERAVHDPDDTEARDWLCFAATLAGLAFGNAGVHIPHAMSYSVAGMNHTYQAAGYESEGGMVPHGLSVVINAPAAFRFTADSDPLRHMRAAQALGADFEIQDADPAEAGDILAGRLEELMRATGIPNGLSGLGYSEADIPSLVAGCAKQQRLLVMAPKEVSENDLTALYRAALRYWDESSPLG